MLFQLCDNILSTPSNVRIPLVLCIQVYIRAYGGVTYLYVDIIINIIAVANFYHVVLVEAGEIAAS